jgi:hypothetical protein
MRGDDVFADAAAPTAASRIKTSDFAIRDGDLPADDAAVQAHQFADPDVAENHRETVVCHLFFHHRARPQNSPNNPNNPNNPGQNAVFSSI